ncbi:hypothetical protein M1816_003908 [Neofusicoccum parvum]|uniref:Uncharacterized protein n=1 Tax=Neofusicoccum parvum TaxID=310453 RepID=A0ACB5SD38_9PEZI|nr:hypothetical protein M1816_003908 [Neofusicoccum parvum]
MPSLSQELVERIASHADRQTRTNMLTASRSFQVAVEGQEFPSWVGLEAGDLEGFLNLYHGHRTRFVRSIQFTVKFANLRGGADVSDPLPCRESLEEIREYDRLFTGQIAALFMALKAFEEREADQPEGIQLTIHIAQQTVIADCDHRRHPSWRVHLLNPESLPQVSCIRSLVFPVPDNCGAGSDEGLRPIDMAAAIDLTARLPNLEELQCPYLFERLPTAYDDAVVQHFTRPWEGPWLDTRHAFARAVREARGNERLKNVRLHFHPTDPFCADTDQARPLPDLVGDPLSSVYDPLSSAVRDFSQRLVELDIRAVCDQSLFWPEASSTVDPPYWPHLRRLHVEFNAATPRGSWYFTDPRGEMTPASDARGFRVEAEHYPPLGPTKSAEDEEWDEVWMFEGGRAENLRPDVFRTEPVAAAVEPLLAAFARALANMPALEQAELFSFLGWSPNDERAEAYDDGPFEMDNAVHRWGVNATVGGGERRLEWQVGAWRPSEEVIKLFQHAFGNVVVVDWVPFKFSPQR